MWRNLNKQEKFFLVPILLLAIGAPIVYLISIFGYAPPINKLFCIGWICIITAFVFLFTGFIRKSSRITLGICAAITAVYAFLNNGAYTDFIGKSNLGSVLGTFLIPFVVMIPLWLAGTFLGSLVFDARQKRHFKKEDPPAEK